MSGADGRSSPTSLRALDVNALSVEVPARDAGAGRRIVESAALRVASALPGFAAGRIEQLDLVVRAPRDASEAALGDAIAEAMLRALTKAQGAIR